MNKQRSNNQMYDWLFQSDHGSLAASVERTSVTCSTELVGLTKTDKLCKKKMDLYVASRKKETKLNTKLNNIILIGYWNVLRLNN